MKSSRMAAAVALALVLAALLGFLYYKTDTGEFRRQVLLLAHLRELKDLDARWDAELLRLRTETGSVKLSTAHLADTLGRALRGLEDEASASRILSAGLPELKRALLEKAALMDEYRKAANAAGGHLQLALGVAPEIGTVLAQVRVYDAKQRDAAATAQAVVGAVQTETLRLNLATDPAQRARLEAALAALAQTPLPANPALPPLLARLRQGAAAFLEAKSREQDLYNRLVFLPAGPRLDTLTTAFLHELEAGMQDRELFRTYLFAYAGILLILLAHFGARLRQSYRDLAAANLALKTANEGLELRVEERTRELSKALKDLEESQAMLVQTEKMSSLGQMVAGIAHEINTPLAYVKNSLETVQTSLPESAALVQDCERLLAMLREGTDEEAFSQQFAKVAQRIAGLKAGNGPEELLKLVQDGQFGIAQITEIVTNLRNFSRLDRSLVDRFNVIDGLESTLSIARHVLKSIAVKKQFGDVPPITCSPSQLNQVFLNLVTNAAQATEGKAGEITITTRAPDPQHVEIEVADNGKGIPADVLPKIFDPFFTTKDVGKGTGLGLSIVYKIVEAHGGKLKVASRPGVGSRFTVTLPVQPPAAARPA